jgi:tRNA pseudouridine55 synthase
MMDGFLIIDKSPGMTSYTVIKRLKRICSFKKIGYIGTLDRNATGILPVALNEGVKLIPFLENGEKRYVARFQLGITTDTYDLDGTKVTEVEPPKFDRATIEGTLSRFQGKISQKVPIYSSKKINGKPLYKWVREGVIIDTPHKEVEVYDIVLLGYDHPFVDVEVGCSKGTYIRVIAQDFGQLVGCGAVLHSLQRTRHGDFTLPQSTTLDKIQSEQDILSHLVPPGQALGSLKQLTIDVTLEKFLKNGMPLPLLGSSREWVNDEYAKLVSKTGNLIAIGRIDTTTKSIRIKRLINN